VQNGEGNGHALGPVDSSEPQDSPIQAA
jgi:hypothetical protein